MVIKFSRNTDIAENIDKAYVSLDSVEFKYGEPVVIRYYNSEGDVDILFAIGTDSGLGRSHCRIISTKEETPINGITHDVVDTSQVVYEQVYLSDYPSYLPEGETWAMVTINGDHKTVQKLVDGSIYRSLDDGFRYFYSNKILKREDEFITPSQLEEAINEKLFKVLHPTITIETVGFQKVTEKGVEHNNPEFKIDVVDCTGEQIAKKVSYKITSANQDCSGEIKERKSSVLVDTVDLVLYGKLNKTTTFTFNVLYGEEETLIGSADFTCYFVNPLYYGKDADELEKALIDPENPNFVLEENLDDDIVIVKYPSTEFELLSVKDDNGLNFKNDYNIEVEDDYTTMTKKDSTRISQFIQEFIFKLL